MATKSRKKKQTVETEPAVATPDAATVTPPAATATAEAASPPPPPEAVTGGGFRFGHSLFGNAAFEVVHFAFEFYGCVTYNVLVNPNDPLVRAVLATMVESGDYFFFAIQADGHATAFRSGLGQANLAGLRDHLPRIQRSTTTEDQYRHAVTAFATNPQPPGVLLDWVCRDGIDYLDPAADRLELTPA